MQDDIAAIYRAESRRVYATLVRLLGDFEFAEDVLQDAFVAAMQQWPHEGLPDNPRAWLVKVARFKAIDRLRRRKRQESLPETLNEALVEQLSSTGPAEMEDIEDDRLRLIFTCCHPALARPVQIALTLREVCGLATEDIASAFLVAPSTLAQRLVRGKAKIRSAGIPYEVPERKELPQRLEVVLTVIYLVFNEGYHASSGDSLLRVELSEEALRLGRLLHDLLPDAEVKGLLALMLFHEARRGTRLDAAGELVLLEDQDRSRWDREMIIEARDWLSGALSTALPGAFTVQAAIAGAHALAARPEETDWGAIVALYDVLMARQGGPVVALNRAVAVAMRDGPAAGLALIEALLTSGDLADYHLAHAARADLCRRLGRFEEATVSYRQALRLARQEPERRFLARRLIEMGSAAEADGAYRGADGLL